jgi:maltooligosyltrehalose trehalohydrolase
VDYDGVDDLADAFEHRWVFRGRWSHTRGRRHGAPVDDVDHRHFVVFAQNHDHVGNTPRGERLLHAAGPGDPRLRLAAATVLLSPFTPLLFMGEEYGETAPFPYFVDHGDRSLLDAVRAGRQREFAGLDWSGGIADPGDPATPASAVLDPTMAESGPHAGLLALYTELIRLRRSTPVLTDPAAHQRVGRAQRTVVLDRSTAEARSHLVLHFGSDPTPLSALADELAGPLDGWSPTGGPVIDTGDARWGSGGPPPGDGELAPWSARLYVDPA